LRATTQIIRSTAAWQDQLRNAVTSIDQLLAMLDLDSGQVDASADACRDFTLKVPMAFVRRMEAGNPEDPLLRQVLASRRELEDTVGYGPDPLAETGEASPRRGIIHKYRGRSLLIVSGGCAINCRYCFRRHFPYGDNQNSRQQWLEALDFIAGDPDITEVILSGGDPLVASDRLLQDLVAQIAAIPHVSRLRVHSRLPVVLPDRITGGLLDAISVPGLQTLMVIHCNHPNEIDRSVGEAIAELRGRGITTLNQAVLLAGINDTAEALTALGESLFAIGVLPYYLHLLDRVQGAAHFDVPEGTARRLLAEVSARLPGYLVPRLVRENPGANAKTILAPLY
jgi:EF-P beta-lysylation protein EpmB